METYCHWMERAFPQPRKRRDFFREKIEGQPISRANLRLAQLLLEKRLATLVVTPNFDDLLSRALTLFGATAIVCDHPSTIQRIDPESSDIQILHVHGTYWFYDLRNLPHEMSKLAQDPGNKAFTISSKLNEVLSRRSPLVIGYSGWENDVIMSSLRRRLDEATPLGDPLYWFCYRRSEIESLPKFLKDHDNVSFVVPRLAAQNESPSPDALQKKSDPVAESSETVLDAIKVMETLVNVFTSNTPLLFKDPVSFFAGQLKRSFLPSGNPGEEIYSLKEVLEKVECAAELLAKWRATKRVEELDQQIVKVRDAVRRSRYVEAIKAASEIKADDATFPKIEDLANLIHTAAMGLSDNSDDELAGYDKVIALLEPIPETDASRERLVKALYRKGFVLGNRGQHDGAIKSSIRSLIVLPTLQSPSYGPESPTLWSPRVSIAQHSGSIRRRLQRGTK